MYAGQYEGSDVRQGFLNEGRFQPAPMTMSNFSDQVEASGAKIEETLQRLNCSASSLFFSAGLVTCAAAGVALSHCLFSFSLATVIGSVFLFVFGSIMVIIDVPGAPMWAQPYRAMAHQQVRFLSKITGKSIWFLYLGSMIVMVLWNSRSGSFTFLMGLVASGFTLTVSIVGLSIGVRKSLQLERVKKMIQANYRGNFSEVFRKYATVDPTHGMNVDEFMRLAQDYTAGTVTLRTSDVVLIMNSLDSARKGAINEREFTEWVNSYMTYL